MYIVFELPLTYVEQLKLERWVKKYANTDSNAVTMLWSEGLRVKTGEIIKIVLFEWEFSKQFIGF